jgi:RsiW-degrading membrane proteinase PrsW (M82 family)
MTDDDRRKLLNDYDLRALTELNGEIRHNDTVMMASIGFIIAGIGFIFRKVPGPNSFMLVYFIIVVVLGGFIYVTDERSRRAGTRMIRIYRGLAERNGVSVTDFVSLKDITFASEQHFKDQMDRRLSVPFLVFLFLAMLEIIFILAIQFRH